MDTFVFVTFYITTYKIASPHSPFDSNTSAVTLMVKGKSLGMTGLRAFSARAPAKNTNNAQKILDGNEGLLD